MAQTKIRLPQLNAESLTVNSTTALVFKEQGVAAAYLTFDTDTSKIDLGDGTVSVKLSGATVMNGAISGTAFKTEDNMASNSGTAVASQASIKAYVDAQVGLQDMDGLGDVGAFHVDLDTQNLSILGGTGLSSLADGSQGITIKLDDLGTAKSVGGTLKRLTAVVDAQGRLSGLDEADIRDATVSDKGVASFATADFGVASGAVTIKALGVSLGQIAADAIDGTKIADNAVDSEHYTDGSIETVHIGDNQVTLAKMASLTATQFILGDGSNNPSAVSMSGDATMSNAGAVTVTQSAGDFLVTGDLNVQGDRNIMNTKHVTFEDVSLTLAIPGGMKDATFAYTHVGTVVTVTSIAHGFATGEFVYFQHDVGTPLFTEEVYDVTRTTADEFTFSALSDGGANIAGPESCMHSGTKILDPGSDGAGIKIPVARDASGGGMPQISWSDSGDKFQVKNADLEVLEDLIVTGAIDANSTSDFQGAMNLQAGITVAGAIDANSTSDFQGAMNLQAGLTVAGVLDHNSTSDFQGAMNLQAGITVAGVSALNGAMTLGNASADTIAMNGTITGQDALRFEGSTANEHDLTIRVADPTQTRQIILPNAGGTFAVSATAASGVALDAAGNLAVAIGGTTSLNAAGLLGVDQFLIDDAGTSKRLSVNDLATYLAGATSDKITGTIGSNGIARYLKVTNVNGFPNLKAVVDSLLFKVEGAGANAMKSEIYLNGMLLSRQADDDYSDDPSALVEDYAHDTDAAAGSPAPGLIFNIPLVEGDHIAVMVRQ